MTARPGKPRQQGISTEVIADKASPLRSTSLNPLPSFPKSFSEAMRIRQERRWRARPLFRVGAHNFNPINNNCFLVGAPSAGSRQAARAIGHVSSEPADTGRARQHHGPRWRSKRVRRKPGYDCPPTLIQRFG